MIVRATHARFLLAVALAGIAAGCAAKQQEFKSPQAAVDSLVAALRTSDNAKIVKILGPDGDDIVWSGDPVDDRAAIARFLAAYDAQHRLQADDKGGDVLLVGAKDWPMPVPIIESKGKYLFDTAAGKDEILNRRIGRNELETELVCLAIDDAQRDYVTQRPMGGDLPVYARKIVSDPGKKNGLYWPTEEGEPPSPLGPQVAVAAAEGYGATRPAGEAAAYHGYRYRLLTSQGPSASGGVSDYEVNGQLIGGFGVVAYPAQYGNSGIMTFITNHDGIVYQSDLGPDTEKIARAMTAFDPGPQWTRATEGSKVGAGD